MAIARDRCSFVSREIKRLLEQAVDEGASADPCAVRARAMIGAERGRQDARWGVQDHDPQVWMAILGEEFGELCQAANDLRWREVEPGGDALAHALEEAVQTAAVAQAVVECLLRGSWRWQAGTATPHSSLLTPHSPQAAKEVRHG